jgi:hypothetical protein
MLNDLSRAQEVIGMLEHIESITKITLNLMKIGAFAFGAYIYFKKISSAPWANQYRRQR